MVKNKTKQFNKKQDKTNKKNPKPNKKTNQQKSPSTCSLEKTVLFY